MTMLRCALVCLIMLFSGCALVPAPYSDQLNPIGDRYSSIRPGSPRAEVETQLGLPIREEDDGAVVWETRIDELNYAKLKVWFGPGDRVVKIETTRAHGKITPVYRASAVTTRSK